MLLVASSLGVLLIPSDGAVELVTTEVPEFSEVPALKGREAPWSCAGTRGSKRLCEPLESLLVWTHDLNTSSWLLL